MWLQALLVMAAPAGGGGVVGNKSDRAHNMRGTWAVLIQMDQDRYSQLSVKAIIYLSWLGGHS